MLQPVSFSLNLGYQVDGARPSGRAHARRAGAESDRDYATLRAYGFGEAFVSTRGLGAAEPVDVLLGCASRWRAGSRSRPGIGEVLSRQQRELAAADRDVVRAQRRRSCAPAGPR